MIKTLRSHLALFLLTIVLGSLSFGIFFSGPIQSLQSQQASLITPLFNREDVDSAIRDIRPSNAPTLDSKINSSTTSNTLVGSVKTILQIGSGLIASFAGTYAIIMLLLHSYKYVTSGGDKGKTDAAIKGIQWSMIGLISITLAYGVVNTIIDFTFKFTSTTYGESATTPATGSEGKTNAPLPTNCPPPQAGGVQGPCT